MLHVKVGLDHNKNLRVSQIVAADTAWAGNLLLEFAHDIDDEFEQIGAEIGLELGIVSDISGTNPEEKSAEPTATTTTTPHHHVTTNGPLRVAPGIVWVIPAYKRSWTLDLVLESLVRAGATDSTIVVSQDADDHGVRDVANKYLKNEELPKLKLVSHPWSCAKHPNTFPGNDASLNEGYKGDSYGNPRSEWATCLKHHWWWLMNYVWTSGADTVCLLEDDILIRPGTLQWLASHSDALEQNFGVKLTHTEIAVPWCMGRSVWDKVHLAAQEFCTHDDYNWDQTLAWMTSKKGHSGLSKSSKATVPANPLSKHIGDCEGWDSGGRNTKCTDGAIAKLKRTAHSWLNAQTVAKSSSIPAKTTQWLRAHSKVNGGWGHPRDHRHCLEISANVSKTMDLHFHREVQRELEQSEREREREIDRKVRDELHAEEQVAQQQKASLRKQQREHLLAEANKRLHHEEVPRKIDDGGLNINPSDHDLPSPDPVEPSHGQSAVADLGPVLRPSSPLHDDAIGDRTIYTEEMFREIKYVDPDGGVWKQGWPYNYDKSYDDSNGETLTIHVMPHSHNDPGWIKTYHSYYSAQTRKILSTMVKKLTEDSRRTFIWAEISFFSLWWNDASDAQKNSLRKLVDEGRWEFVTGGWVMNDEACVSARAVYAQLEEGRLWLKETLGIVPTVSWQIDPFGHSAGQAQILKQLGYKAVLIQRVHYAIKKRLAKSQDLEFMWETHEGPIFTQLMPFFSYDAPHTCGPDPAICCQFDFARMPGQHYSCPWRKAPKKITSSNVKERSELWLDQVMKKAMLNRHRHVLVPLGDDFRYDGESEADVQFQNYQRMFDYINTQTHHNVKVKFSTLSQYFEGAMGHGTKNFPVMRGSFFPYADRQLDYWTGYFNSRIFYKGMDRKLEGYLAAAEYACNSKEADALHSERQALALFQHHDGITGTAKSFVVQDYFQTMQTAIDSLHSKIGECMGVVSHAGGKLTFNPTGLPRDGHQPWEVLVHQESECVPIPLPTSGDNLSPTERVGLGRDGHLTALEGRKVVETLAWTNNQKGQTAGAYLMAVQGKSESLRLKSKAGSTQPISMCRDESAAATHIRSSFDMVTRTVVVPDDKALPLRFQYDVDIRSRNNGELWTSYRLEGIDSNQQQLCADVHGLQYECHSPRFSAPLQAQFYPMPTMAWQEDARTRFSWVSAQPTGIANLQTGLTIMLDRCGNRDDARGLGQGVTDPRPATLKFEAMVETLRPGAMEAAFGPPYEGFPSLRAITARTRTLNPIIELDGSLEHTRKVDEIRQRLPQWNPHETHWTNHHVTTETIDERWQ